MRIVFSQLMICLCTLVLMSGQAAAHPASAGHIPAMQGDVISPFQGHLDAPGMHCPMHGHHGGKPCPHQKWAGAEKDPRECQLRADCHSAPFSKLPDTHSSQTQSKVLSSAVLFIDETGMNGFTSRAHDGFHPLDPESLDPPPRLS